MSEDEIQLKIKLATQVIARTQRLARDYNRTIRENKAEKKRLEKVLRAMIREKTRKHPPYDIQHPCRPCQHQFVHGSQSCFAYAMASGYCYQHRPDREAHTVAA